MVWKQTIDYTAVDAGPIKSSCRGFLEQTPAWLHLKPPETKKSSPLDFITTKLAGPPLMGFIKALNLLVHIEINAHFSQLKV